MKGDKVVQGRREFGELRLEYNIILLKDFYNFFQKEKDLYMDEKILVIQIIKRGGGIK